MSLKENVNVVHHIRVHILLIVGTLLICAVAYPLALLLVGGVVFPEKSKGSLIVEEDGRVVGSRLVAQKFEGDQYFWPRPSAADYNGAASGGSNLGASNPKLRARVARQLGAIVRYRHGKLVGPDIERWAAVQPEAVRARAGELPDNPKPSEIQAAFFDLWLQAHPDADLAPVPADMVMASGSGLDPHITLRNALSIYQLDRVAEARGAGRKDVERVVRAKAFTPLASEPLVNVLELNLAFDEEFPMKR
jgi:K+-transporting ATPase KdpC subunit